MEEQIVILAALKKAATSIVQWIMHPDVARQLHNLKKPMRRKMERYKREIRN